MLSFSSFENLEKKLIESPEFSDLPKTLFIVDYDDTLINSTELTDLEKITGDIIELDGELKLKLEKNILTLFETIKNFGELHIVTNSQRGWIEISLERWFRSLIPIFKGVEYISARDIYENISLNSHDWKFFAFSDLYEEFSGYSKEQLLFNDFNRLSLDSFDDYLNERFQIISIGDSLAEKNALFKVHSIFSNSGLVSCKNIQLKSKPSLEDIISQIESVCGILEKIIKVDCSRLELVFN